MIALGGFVVLGQDGIPGGNSLKAGRGTGC